MTEQSSTQTHAFQAEVQQVLHLMIHSLYSNKEIFLRELISNASDACDKLRFQALTDDSLLGGDPELRIEIEIDPELHTLTVRDNGLGMRREEVIENIGTIARSGTRQFLEQASGDADQDLELIGQFGVGFYSSFIVADRVTLLSRRAGDPPGQGVRWESDGTGEFSIADETRERQGTEVVLHLKEEEREFLQPWTLRALISRYSDHIGFPICLRKDTDESPDEPEAGDRAGDQDGEDSGWTTVNQASALWTLPKSEIEPEEYQSFYRHVSHDLGDALNWTHNKVEGNQNYTSLLYIPSHAPLDIMLQRDERRGLRLYVKRVFIMDAAEQLLPHYLRFIRGVVDSDDLPLNVSRELLQENALVAKIRAAIVRRSLDMIERLADKEPEKFDAFWDEFGPVLKEGIVEDLPNKEKIAGLLRFASTRDESGAQRTSLADYIGRMQVGQKNIWYVTAENHHAAARSPHLEVFRKKGIEVLLMSDRIDEWMMGYFTELDGKAFRSIAKGEIDFDADPAETGESATDPDDGNDLLKRLADALDEKVADVRASRRLTESASCLVLGEQELAMHMRHMLEQAGQKLPDAKPVLEVNLDHGLVRRLEGDATDAEFSDLAWILYGQAVLAEGGQLDDPAGFVQRLNRVMLTG